MNVIELKSQKNRYLISLDKSSFDKKTLLSILEQLRIEFLAKEKKKHPKAGCMKGTFIMSDDFDAPLEDFQDICNERPRSKILTTRHGEQETSPRFY